MSSPQCECPKCGSLTECPYEWGGNDITCTTCKEVFHFIKPEMEDIEVEEEEEEEAKDFLDWIERLLVRAIIGIPKFIFYIAPRYIWECFCRAFPAIVRFSRIGFLFGLWIVMAFWPVVFSETAKTKSILYRIDANAISNLNTLNRPWGDVFLAIWASLAITGSIWGTIYVRLRRKRKLSSEEHAPDLPVHENN